MRARCPECDELVEITPTGRKQQLGRSSEWWRLVLHPDKRSPGSLCAGGGRDV